MKAHVSMWEGKQVGQVGHKSCKWGTGQVGHKWGKWRISVNLTTAKWGKWGDAD